MPNFLTISTSSALSSRYGFSSSSPRSRSCVQRRAGRLPVLVVVLAHGNRLRRCGYLLLAATLCPSCLRQLTAMAANSKCVGCSTTIPYGSCSDPVSLLALQGCYSEKHKFWASRTRSNESGHGEMSGISDIPAYYVHELLCGETSW